MYCERCGNVIDEASIFCDKCGAKIKKDEYNNYGSSEQPFVSPPQTDTTSENVIKRIKIFIAVIVIVFIIAILAVVRIVIRESIRNYVDGSGNNYEFADEYYNDYVNSGSAEINQIKSGFFTDYEDELLGDAFEDYFEDYSWDYYASDEDTGVVEFNGYDGYDKKFTIQFVKENGSDEFQLGDSYVDGVLLTQEEDVDRMLYCIYTDYDWFGDFASDENNN